MKKILIIGGTGFIGYHLAKASKKRKFKVTSISTKKPKKNRYVKGVIYKLCNITNKISLEKKIQGYFDYVVNLGGYVDHSNKNQTFKSHYFGVKNLTKIFLKKPPKLFVQMGSCVEYGKIRSPQKEEQSSKLDLIKSTYGKAKLKSTQYLIDLFKNNQFPSVILRLYIAFGPKQEVNRFIPITISACLKNKKFNSSTGTQMRDFIYLDDVIEAIFKCFKNKKSHGQIFNIGSGKPKKVKDIIEKVKKISGGGSPQFGKVKLRKDEIKYLYPSINKAKKLLKWKPTTTFDNGLKKTIRSYNEKKKI